MEIFRFRYNSFFDRRFTADLIRLAESSEDLKSIFNLESSAIYRIPFPDRNSITITLVDNNESFVVLRTSREKLFGLGPRIYVIDTAPMALLAKPSAVAVFNGFNREPQIFETTTGNIGFDGSLFPFYSASNLRSMAIFNGESIQGPDTQTTVKTSKDSRFENVLEISDTEDGDSTGGLELFQSGIPLTGGFPGTDLPMPPIGTPYPIPPIAPPPTIVKPPLGEFLFYGLCFESTVQPFTVGGLAWGGYNQIGQLWKFTEDVRDSFKKRGYKTNDGLAGDHAPDGGSADTFERMMTGLENDLDKNPAYCNSKNDQLVIFVTAHGYGSAIEDVAFEYDVESNKKSGSSNDIEKRRERYISYKRFFNKLASIPQIAKDPSKVYLIIHSCNSGRTYEGGILPKSLKGLNLLTSDNALKLCHITQFPTNITKALDRGATTWTQLVQAVKTLSAPPSPPGVPGNATVQGCLATITLQTVNYLAADIGTSWEYNIRLDGVLGKNANNVQRVALSTPTNIAEHELPFNTTETLNKVLYEAFWKACNPTNKVTIGYEVEAIEHDLFDDSEKTTGTITFFCNGGSKKDTVTLNVSEGSKTARLDFVLQTSTQCL